MAKFSLFLVLVCLFFSITGCGKAGDAQVGQQPNEFVVAENEFDQPRIVPYIDNRDTFSEVEIEFINKQATELRFKDWIFATEELKKEVFLKLARFYRLNCRVVLRMEKFSELINQQSSTNDVDEKIIFALKQPLPDVVIKCRLPPPKILWWSKDKNHYEPFDFSSVERQD